MAIYYNVGEWINTPLVYVAIYQAEVKPHAMDPAIDDENVYQEITSRAPHDQYVYDADNKTL